MRTLVLWDIDHTLISLDGLSLEIYGDVFHEVTGDRLRFAPDMAGRIEHTIMSETLRRHGIEPTRDTMRTMADALAQSFTRRNTEIGARGRALPGARDALETLAARTDVVQSVLTGNIRPVALCKLAAFGLDTLVDLDVGAYGFDATERPALVGLAQRRATREYGVPFAAATTVLIGDTPHDIAAGRRGGARVIAVATGSSNEATLRSAGADVVLTNLADTAATVAAILDVG
jgi:phosphoglycolate phosphatase-like HAD superfamily hydrolase